MTTFIYSISFNVSLKNRRDVEKLLQECPAFTYDVEVVEEGVAIFDVFDTFVDKNSQKSEEEQSFENFTNLLEKLYNIKTFIYLISFNVPLKNKGDVEKLLQNCPTFKHDVDILEEEEVALFNVFNTFVDKNSQKSEEEQSVENFTNLLEKLKNL